MDTRWLVTIADLFRPEHSLRLSCEKRKPVGVIRPICSGPGVSIKALFWVAVSILAGLAIGQLC